MSVDHPKSFATLQALAKSWGGAIVPDSMKCYGPQPRGIYPCPFGTYSIHHARKIIYYDPDMPVSVGELIHEAAHTFVCRQTPNRTDDEMRFVGWEMALAIQLKVRKSWLEAMRDYMFADGSDSFLMLPECGSSYELGSLNAHELRAVFKHHIADAERRKLIVDGVPVAKR